MRRRGKRRRDQKQRVIHESDAGVGDTADTGSRTCHDARLRKLPAPCSVKLARHEERDVDAYGAQPRDGYTQDSTEQYQPGADAQNSAIRSIPRASAAVSATHDKRR